MTILVTGGAGFIGSNFVIEWLLKNKEHVVNLDKLTYAGNAHNLDNLKSSQYYFFVRGDIGNTQLINQLLNERQPRYIINFAAESHVDRSICGPEDFIQTNIVSTFHLLESTRAYWDRLEDSKKNDFRFLHVSTDEVYGSLEPDDSAFTEYHCYKPNSPYSASKAASDHLVRAYHHTYGLPTLTTNCSNNYGPYQFPEKLIPLVIYNALSGQDIPIYGDGQQIRDWLYVSDHCNAILRILKEGLVGEIYNIGGLNEKTNNEVSNMLCDILDELHPRVDNRSYKLQIKYIQDRAGHDRRYAVDTNKIKCDLDWFPLETFETGMQKTVKWYLDNQKWVENVTSGAYRDWVEKQY